MNKNNQPHLLLDLTAGDVAPASMLAASLRWVMGALLLLALFAHQLAQAFEAYGQVTAVSDGDTFWMDLDGTSTRVRLADIDAPEKAQAFGRRSEQSLRELVAKRGVVVSWSAVDRYGRPLVRVRAGDVDVNAEQVKRGFAWVYRQYSKDPQLIALEEEARAAKRGLWADSHPVEPWNWRKTKQNAAGQGGQSEN